MQSSPDLQTVEFVFRDKVKGDSQGHTEDDLSKVLQTQSLVKLNTRLKEVWSE